MVMKYLSLLLIFLTLFTSNIIAQVSQTEIDYIQSKYGADKKEIVANFVNLQGKEEKSFWEIYDTYEIKRKEIGVDRFKLTLHYSNNQLVFSDDDLEDEIDKFIGIKNDTDELIENYYNKIRRKIGVQTASRFYMIERYFQNVVRVNYMKQIPFMNDLENKKNK